MLLINAIKPSTYRLQKACVTALLLLVPFALQGQNVNIPFSGSFTYTLAAGGSITVLDPGGTGNYPGNCEGTLAIVSAAGTAITVNGYYYLEYNDDYISFYEGPSTSGTHLGTFTGLGNLSVCANTGTITIRFHSNHSISYSGVNLTAMACGSVIGGVYNVTSDVTDSTALLTWSDSSSAVQWTVVYGEAPHTMNHQTTVTSPMALLVGLRPNRTCYYRIYQGNGSTAPCGAALESFVTTCGEPRTGCIDFCNLNSCRTVASYGTFANPSDYIGVVDSGSSNAASRHTVHTDTSERDPRTGNQLRTVPQGYGSSVRLGNWQVNGQAETIVYEYEVDTTVSDLMIMRYAAVLQNPNHSVGEQPRFSFEILDGNGDAIDECYTADFVAGSGLGWNIYKPSGPPGLTDTVLWKDWTAVGVDLTPLHGQVIHIRLTTRDCSRHQHFGYAYYVFECGTKQLTYDNCGPQIENTFSAPDGFSYRWYNSDSVATTLSTSRQLHVTEPGEYNCRLQFAAATASSSCSFVLKAVASERYPAAIFSWDTIGYDDCLSLFQLHNNSVVSTDSTLTQLTSQPCDSIAWTIDDSISLSGDNPTVALDQGLHTIRLVAFLTGGGCSDTMQHDFSIVSPCYRDDTVAVTICDGSSYTFFDTVLTDSGVWVRDSAYHHRTLLLTVSSTYDTAISRRIVENSLPYSFAGRLYTDTITNDTVTLHTVDGCDSVIRFTLQVDRNRRTILDSTLCESLLPLVWNGVTFIVDSVFTTVVIVDSAIFVAQSGADSTVEMSVTVIPTTYAAIYDTVVENQLPVSLLGSQITVDSFISFNYYSHFVIENAAGCDSVVDYNLFYWPNVEAVADSTVCWGTLPLVWNGVTFNVDSISAVVTLFDSVVLTARSGADSLLVMRVTVLPTTSATIVDTVVQNQLPKSFMGAVVTESMLGIDEPLSTFNFRITTVNMYGCDSIVNYSLAVWRNRRQHLYKTLCSDMLPTTWNGVTFDSVSTSTIMLTDSVTLTTLGGADSVVEMTLTVYPAFDVNDTSVICDGDTSSYGYTVGGNYDIMLQTVDGCDSLLHLEVLVKPVYNNYFADSLCDNQIPYLFFDTLLYPEATTTYIFPHRTHGFLCDSIQTLRLTVFATSHLFDHAVVCDGVPYTWIDGNSYPYTTYEPTVTYSDIHGCDSVRHLLLELDTRFEARMDISPTIVSNENPQVWLYDKSASSSRVWYYDLETDTSRIHTFTFPSDRDSLPILMVARSTIGCIDSVRGVVYADRSVIWAPNAFTPDESTNDRFFIPSTALASGEVWIYDRTGNLVTHFDAIGGSWDGTCKGRPCPQAAYTWIMKYTTLVQPQTPHQAKGTVLLLR